MTVVRTNVFQPSAVIAEKVSESPRVAVECKPQKRQVRWERLANKFPGAFGGHFAFEEIILILSKLMQAASAVGFEIETRALPLSRIEEAWAVESATPRIVLTVGEG